MMQNQNQNGNQAGQTKKEVEREKRANSFEAQF